MSLRVHSSGEEAAVVVSLAKLAASPTGSERAFPRAASQSLCYAFG